VGLALVLVAFTLVSRLLTVVPPLYLMRQGLRASLVPAINLAQISEFSLVLIQVGVQSGHTSPSIASAASLAFVVLAVASTFLIMRSDPLTRLAIPALKQVGVNDLDHRPADADSPAERKRRILVLGFYRTASSFLSELERRHAALLEQVCVVDFNPNVYRALQMRNLKVYYGDVSHADTLAQTGVSDAEIIICSVPDSLLKGTTNERLVRQLRALNPTAKIIATADVLGQTTRLYAAGADYVTIARLAEADELINAVTAAEAGLLDDLRASLEARLQARNEILP
jgi:voltage-gated potassium channel Kch